MSDRKVFCVKSNKEAEGLDRPPYPGPLGQKIYEHISKESWKEWLNYQIMLINEYRLNMADKRAREYLLEQMDKFLFSDEVIMPEGYVPVQKKSDTNDSES